MPAIAPNDDLPLDVIDSSDVNRFADDSPDPVIPAPDYTGLEADQVAALKAFRKKRDAAKVNQALTALTNGAAQLMRDDVERPKMMDRIIDAVRVRATVGEISETLATNWGIYRPSL